ncbi:MAG TPA: hypothetical protein VH165_15840 [Kofleriaceae bacterium]|jgi:hypothetical protein|nr:hypothetical protein [Kofleriaceae bacterium]
MLRGLGIAAVAAACSGAPAAAPPAPVRPAIAGTAAGSAAPGSAAPGSAAPGSAAPGSAAPGSAAPGSAAPGSAADGPLDQDLPRLIARSLALYQDVAAALDAAAGDCAAATTRLDQLAAPYRDVVTASAKVVHDGRAAALRAALEPHAEAFTTAATAVMHAPTMAACATDAAFRHALDALFASPVAPPVPPP